MIAALVVVSLAFLVIGAAGIFAWVMDWREARACSAARAEQLVAWAEVEAAVLGAESRLAHLRDADGYLDLSAMSPSDEAAFYDWDELPGMWEYADFGGGLTDAMEAARG